MTRTDTAADSADSEREPGSPGVGEEPERPYEVDWYLDFAAELTRDLAEGRSVGWQRQAMVSLYRRFLRNLGDNDKRVLAGSQLDEFLALVDAVAARLDPQTLAERIGRVPEHFRRYLLAARGESAGPACVEITSIMVLDGELLIYGFVASPQFGPSDALMLRLTETSSREPGAGLERPSGTRVLPDQGLRHSYRYFGRELVAYRAFDLRLPVSQLPPGTRLAWQTTTGPGRAPLRFSRAASRFAPELGVTYVSFGDLALRYRDHELRVLRPTRWAGFTGELRALAGIRKAKLKPYDKLREFGLRVLYHLTRPCFSRRLVLYFDKLYMGGDNGQQLFEFASEQARAGKAKAEHRYVLHPSNPGYPELRARGLALVNFGSPLRKLYALNAYLVAATHPNVFAYCGLNAFERRWFAGLLRAHVVCIQHGLTVQYIPQHQARQIDNTERYYCASPAEIANLRQPAYCYPEGSLKLTGLARYDGLVPDPQPVVLVCPTWRRYVANDVTRMGRTRQYTESFTSSPFYQVYADLLTDPTLLAGLRDRGHRLRFVLHPTLVEQAGDFLTRVSKDALASRLVEVEPASARGYEHHLRQGAILVTDYSGIQFDFATMRKPLLYFHPPELPPSYPMGGYDAERDGFGPVVGDLPALREALFAMLDAGARLSPAYARRIDSFFPFDDRENRARIYAELLKDYDLG